VLCCRPSPVKLPSVLSAANRARDLFGRPFFFFSTSLAFSNRRRALSDRRPHVDLGAFRNLAFYRADSPRIPHSRSGRWLRPRLTSSLRPTFFYCCACEPAVVLPLPVLSRLTSLSPPPPFPLPLRVHTARSSVLDAL